MFVDLWCHVAFSIQHRPLRISFANPFDWLLVKWDLVALGSIPGRCMRRVGYPHTELTVWYPRGRPSKMNSTQRALTKRLCFLGGVCLVVHENFGDPLTDRRGGEVQYWTVDAGDPQY